MGVTPAAQQRINKEKQLTEQIIYDPGFQIDKFQALPFTNFLRTNSFVQQTASRLFGKNVAGNKWFALQADDQGRLILSPQVTPGAKVFIQDRNFTDDLVMNEISLPNNAAATHAGVNVSGASRKTIGVSSTENVLVQFQVSDDNINWYTVQNTNDTEFNFNVSNEKKAIEFIDAAHFMRIVITNTSGATSTVTAVIMALT